MLCTGSWYAFFGFHAKFFLLLHQRDFFWIGLVTSFLTRNWTKKNQVYQLHILTPSQFGFRENSSTDLTITTFYDQILNDINDGKIICSIFLDLKKTFDSVDITIMDFEALHSIY